MLITELIKFRFILFDHIYISICDFFHSIQWITICQISLSISSSVLLVFTWANAIGISLKHLVRFFIIFWLIQLMIFLQLIPHLNALVLFIHNMNLTFLLILLTLIKILYFWNRLKPILIWQEDRVQFP